MFDDEIIVVIQRALAQAESATLDLQINSDVREMLLDALAKAARLAAALYIQISPGFRDRVQQYGGDELLQRIDDEVCAHDDG